MATVNWSLQHKRDTAANWTANNPTLLAGQIGIETDNLTTTPKFKIGNGTSTWTALPYFYGGALSAQNLSNVLSVGNTTGGLDLVVSDDDIIQIGTTPNRYIGYSTATVTSGLEIVNLNSNDHIVLQDAGGIHIDTTKVILEQLTASRILSLNANKEIVSPYNTTGSGTTLALSTSPTFITDITTPKVNGVTTLTLNGTGGNVIIQNFNTQTALFTINRAEFTGVATTSGASQCFTITVPAHTGQTASAEISNFKVNGASKTWAAGAITTQRWNYFTANTAAFASASTIAESFGMYVEAATLGANATITNNFALGLKAGTATLKFGHVTGDTTTAAIYLNQSTPSNTNYSIYATPTTTALNGAVTGVALWVGGMERILAYGLRTSGSASNFNFTTSNNTGMTASTEIPGYLFNSYSRQWNTGNITTQREKYHKTVTYSFVGASTITNAYGLYVEAATAGNNATITNNWALGTNGGIFLNGTANTVLGNAALATNATTGFLHVPSCAGVPTGVPTLYTGMIPVVCDSTNNKLYIYSGGAWVALN